MFYHGECGMLCFQVGASIQPSILFLDAYNHGFSNDLLVAAHNMEGLFVIKLYVSCCVC